MVVVFGGEREGDTKNLTRQNGVVQRNSEVARGGSPLGGSTRNESSSATNERSDLTDARSVGRSQDSFAKVERRTVTRTPGWTEGATPDYPVVRSTGTDRRDDIVTDGASNSLSLDRITRNESSSVSLAKGVNERSPSNGFHPNRFPSHKFPSEGLPPHASPSNGFTSNGLPSYSFARHGRSTAFLKNGTRSDTTLLDEFAKYQQTEVNLRTARDYFIPERSVDDERSTITETELLCLRPEEILCAQDKDGDNELMLAIMKHRVIYVLMVIDLLVKRHSAALLNLKNNNGLTALHLAVKVDEVDVTLKLMEANVDYEIRDNDGNTPLHLACLLGRIKHVAALTGNHPVQIATASMRTSTNNTNSVQQTAATAASSNGVQHNRTTQTKYDPTPYRNCANLLNYNSWNCLHLAVKNGHFEVAEYLVSVLGVDVNARGGGRGMGIVHIAEESQDMPLLLLIIRCLKADINLQTYDGWSPIEFAAFRNDVVMARVLLTHGGHAGDYLNCREKAAEGAEASPEVDSEEDD